MKREDLFDAIGHVDEDLLDEDVTPAEPAIWRYVAGITTAAACVAVILGTAGWAKLHQQRPPVQTKPDMTTESEETTAPEETDAATAETEVPSEAVVLVTTVVSDVPETTALLTETLASTEVSTSTSETVETTTVAETEAATEPTEVNDWKSAYRSVVENGEFMNDFSKDQLQFALQDIDGVGTPELIVNINGYLMFMYTWADGETYTLMDGWPYGAGGNAGYQWIAGQNRFYNHNSDYAGLVQNNWFFRIGANHQFEDVASVTVCIFNDINGNLTLDEDQGEVWEADEEHTTYYVNGTQVTEAEANVYLDELDDFAAVDGDTAYVNYDSIMAQLKG